MGATGSTEEPEMHAIDYETYEGPRFSQMVPNSRESTRGPIFETSDAIHVDESKLTLYDNFLSGLALEEGTRRCFGTRAMENGVAGAYEWMTYKAAFARAKAIAAGLAAFAGLQRQQAVGLFSKNRVEWSLAALACDRMAYISVGLYDTLGPEAIPFIINHTELTTLLCAQEGLDTILACKDKCGSLQFIIQFEDVTEQDRSRASEKNVELKSLAEIEVLGTSTPVPADPPRPEDIATLCYTSGTTGDPKGVILLHRNLSLESFVVEDRLQFSADMVHISYLPLPHIMERAVQATLVRMGACMGFYQGDRLKLMDDIAELQPTVLVAVPRVLNRICDTIRQRMEAAGGIKKVVFDHAYEAKRAALADGFLTHAVWDLLVFGKIQQVLGGRVRSILSGSAPLAAEVKELLTIVFACPVQEAYGLSETTAAVTGALTSHALGAHVGPPMPHTQIRLEDVPEMGYTSNDLPRPRGEVLCRGGTVCAGYYKEPTKTAEAIDQDGWFRTGDIGCWNADGTLSIIDRKKNIFKLSQGEYVAAEWIEGICSRSKYIAQIFVYGDSLKDHLVAVAVPDPDIAQLWASSRNLEEEAAKMTTLVKDSEFRNDVLADVTKLCKEAKLKHFQYVKKLHLHADLFSVEDGLITPTFKLKRPQLKAEFQAQIDAMYASTT